MPPSEAAVPGHILCPIPLLPLVYPVMLYFNGGTTTSMYERLCIETYLSRAERDLQQNSDDDDDDDAFAIKEPTSRVPMGLGTYALLQNTNLRAAVDAEYW